MFREKHYTYKPGLTELKHYVNMQDGRINHNEIKRFSKVKDIMS